MSRFLTLSKHIVLLLVVFVVLSLFQLAQTAAVDDTLDTDMSDAAGEKAHHQRRTNDLNKLRHFLLTSNAKQRAAKREKENSLKRELIREYLDAINDPDSSRLEKMKKRFTYCSIQDIMHESLCRRRTIRR